MNKIIGKSKEMMISVQYKGKMCVDDLTSIIQEKCFSFEDKIEELKLKDQEFKKLLQDLQTKQAIHIQNQDNFNFSDYISEDDTNLYFQIQEKFYNDINIDNVDLLENIISRISVEDEKKKIMNEVLKNLQKKIDNYEIFSKLESIDMSGNKNITTAFFEEMVRTVYLDNLFYLNLSKTSVCGEIFKQLSGVDTQKLQQFIKNKNLLNHKMTLDEQDLAKQLQVDNVANEIDKDDQIILKDDHPKGDISERVENDEEEESLKQKKKEELPEVSSPKSLSRHNIELEYKGVNSTLEVLNLGQCRNIKPQKFEDLFKIIFTGLQELNLFDCCFFDNQFEVFKNARTMCFPLLKILNLKYSKLTNEAIWSFLKLDDSLIEVYLDFSNFSICPTHLRTANITQKKDKSKENTSRHRQTLKDRQKTNEKDGNQILPTVFLFSVQGCKLWMDIHLFEILEIIKSPIFDFNLFINSYRHLITKKLVYYIIKDYSQIKNYFYFNLSGAALPDIKESEKYKEETVQFYQRAFIGFSKQQEEKQVFSSSLESLVVDDTRINFKLYAKILKYHPQVRYISCQNTPYLEIFTIKHKKVFHPFCFLYFN